MSADTVATASPEERKSWSHATLHSHSMTFTADITDGEN